MAAVYRLKHAIAVFHGQLLEEVHDLSILAPPVLPPPVQSAAVGKGLFYNWCQTFSVQSFYQTTEVRPLYWIVGGGFCVSLLRVRWSLLRPCVANIKLEVNDIKRRRESGRSRRFAKVET